MRAACLGWRASRLEPHTDLDFSVPRGAGLVPAQCPRNSEQVLLAFEVKFAKRLDQGRNTVLDRRNAVDYRPRLLPRIVLLSLILADALEEPDQRYSEQ